MKAALAVLNNCLGGSTSEGSNQAVSYHPFTSPAILPNTPKSTATPAKQLYRRCTPSQCLRLAWECAQQNSAIMVLTKLLHVKEPPTDADSLREAACRVLNGLARHEPVRQILSKLPLIAASEINGGWRTNSAGQGLN